MRVLALLAIVALAGVAVQATRHHSHSRPAVGNLFTHLPYEVQETDLEPAFRHITADGTPAGSTKNCAFCVLGISLLEQYAIDYQLTLSQAANNWCADLTEEVPLLTGVCQLLIAGAVTSLQNDFNNGTSPDQSCRTTFTSCAAAAPSCILYPQWPLPPHKEVPRVGVREGASQNEIHGFYSDVIGKFLNMKAIDEEFMQGKVQELAGSSPNAAAILREKMMKASAKGDWLPVPIPDGDKDLYGSTFTYRGIQFRGKDCNDGDATVYPGKNALTGDFDASSDTNCNGIFGTDSESNTPYEELYCADTPPRGILAIGDSATAHFSLPPTYFTPSGFNISTYSHLLQELVTEADWPHCSWSTAWANSTVCPYTSLNISSIYTRMLDRNRCMFRDYVNAGVNGGSVDNLIEDGPVIPSNYSGPMLAYPARYKNDGPSTVFFSMVGNDICHAHGWNGATYTPSAIFSMKAQEEFAYLDTILAPKSHVIIMGLVDGRVLYDTLHDAIHPAGSTYAQFYDYLNCLEISPCWGWMNSNETIRDASTAQAFEYNQIYQDIIANTTFNNFDLHYFFPDFQGLISNWTASGGNPIDLIEPVDGFHPSQTGNMLLAGAMWDFITENVPEAMGEINPANAEIIATFGDQGGYGL